MVELGGWFKDEFWVGTGTNNRINTKLITKQLESYLPSDPADVLLEGGLRGAPVQIRQSGLDYVVSTAAYIADMVSQLIEGATARKLLSGPGKGPGRQQTSLRPTAVVCPVPSCHELIGPSRLMCRRDWHRVPKRLRDRVWYTWRSGQGASSRGHCAVARLAIAVCIVRRVAGL